MRRCAHMAFVLLVVLCGSHTAIQEAHTQESALVQSSTENTGVKSNSTQNNDPEKQDEVDESDEEEAVQVTDDNAESTEVLEEDDSLLILPPVEVDEASEPELTEPGRESVSVERAENQGRLSLLDLLETVSGALPTNPTGTTSGVVVDGLPSSHVVFTRDGVPVGRATGSPTGPVQDVTALNIDPELIERVDIRRGGGPTGSGVGAGVVIDLVSARPEPGFFARGVARLGTEFGSLHDQRYRVSTGGTLTEDWSITGQAHFQESEPLDVNGDDIWDLSANRTGGGEISSTWYANDGTVTARTWGHHQEKRALGAANAPLFDITRTSMVHADVLGRWGWGDHGLDHTTSFQWIGHDFLKGVRSSGFERPKADTDAIELRQVLASHHALGDHEITPELVIGWNHVERSGETGDVDPVDEGGVTAGATHQWWLSDSVVTELRGLAHVHSQQTFAWDSAVGLEVFFLEHFSTSLRGYRSTRFPTVEERFLRFDHSELGYAIEGNPELEPEVLWAVRGTLGVLDLGELVTVRLAGFFNRIDNLVDTVPLESSSSAGVQDFSYQNREAANIAGLDVSISVRNIPGGLGAQLGYQWLPLAEEATSGERLLLRPHHSGHASVTGDWLEGRLSAWLRLQTRSDLPVAVDQVAAPGFWWLGAGLRGVIWEEIAASVAVNNLLDQSNATWGPMPGLHMFVTLEFGYRTED